MLFIVVSLLQEHAELLVVLDEFKNVHDSFAGARIGHDALYLAHFVQPEFSEIGIDGGSSLSPKLEASLDAGQIVDDLELR